MEPPRSCPRAAQEPPGAAQEPPGAARSRQDPPGAARSRQEHPGIPRTPRNRQEPPGTPRSPADYTWMDLDYTWIHLGYGCRIYCTSYTLQTSVGIETAYPYGWWCSVATSAIENKPSLMCVKRTFWLRAEITRQSKFNHRHHWIC